MVSKVPNIGRGARARWAAAAVLVAAATASQAASYGFDVGSEGWTAVLGGELVWNAVGGSPGGFLRVADVSNDDLQIVAPASALGDWSSYLGGAIAFDARNVLATSDPSNHTPDWFSFGEVTINGVTVDLIPVGAPPADDQWHHYVVPLTTAVWGANLPSLLSNVTSFTIRGEFHAGVTETVGFDNITISAVPELPAPALMLAGLVMLGAATLKRRGA